MAQHKIDYGRPLMTDTYANTTATYKGTPLQRGHRIDVAVGGHRYEATVLDSLISKSGTILVCERRDELNDIDGDRIHTIRHGAVRGLYMFMDMKYQTNPGQSQFAHEC